MDAYRPACTHRQRSATLGAALKRSPAIDAVRPVRLEAGWATGGSQLDSQVHSGQHPPQPLTGHPPIAPLSAPRLAGYRAAWPHSNITPPPPPYRPALRPTRPSRTSTPSITAAPSPSSSRRPRRQTSSTSPAWRRSSPTGRVRARPVKAPSPRKRQARSGLTGGANRPHPAHVHLEQCPPGSRPASGRGRACTPLPKPRRSKTLGTKYGGGWVPPAKNPALHRAVRVLRCLHPMPTSQTQPARPLRRRRPARAPALPQRPPRHEHGRRHHHRLRHLSRPARDDGRRRLARPWSTPSGSPAACSPSSAP